jgi:hypothetical protein
MTRYSEDVIETMAQGFSITAYAGKIGVDRTTIDEWRKRHPEFSLTISRAMAARLLFWEKCGLDISKEGGQSSRATLVIFGLMNMGGDEWAR